MDVKDALIFPAHPLKHAGTEHVTTPLKLPVRTGKAELTEKGCRKQH